jgi:hypothetical protein
MSPKFVVNGEEYDRIEDMPAEVRGVYQSLGGLLADADHNGIPDIMEGKGTNIQIGTTNPGVNIVHDGKVYTSVSDLPPDLRAKYEKAMQTLGSMGGSGVAGSGAMPATISNMFSAAVTSHILHDGKVFTDPSQLPPEARERYEKAMKLLIDANQNGIPDILESASALQAARVSTALSGSQTAGVSTALSGSQAAGVSSVPSAAPSAPPPARPAEGSGRNLMIAAMLLLLLAGLVVIVALMMVIQSR